MSFKQFPLAVNDVVKIYYPNLDFFLEKIKNLEYFSMIRFADWWWEGLLRAFNKIDPSFDIMKDNINLNNSLIKKIGQHFVDVGKNHPYNASLPIMIENVRITIGECPSNLFFTVKADELKRRYLVKKLTLNDEFLYAHSWRNFATTGEIHRLFEENSNYHFIMIGPFFYKNFGKKLSLNKFSFVEIDERNGCANVDATISKIINMRQAIKNQKVICLFSAGGMSPYIITKLHKLLNNTFLIDVGRALDAYYCHDNVLINGPDWRWSGAWFGPLYPRKAKKEWTKWTLKYKG